MTKKRLEVLQGQQGQLNTLRRTRESSPYEIAGNNDRVRHGIDGALSVRIARAITDAARELLLAHTDCAQALFTAFGAQSISLWQLYSFEELAQLSPGVVILVHQPHHTHLVRIADCPLEFERSQNGRQCQGRWCHVANSNIEELILSRSFSDAAYQFFKVDSQLTKLMSFSAAK